MIRMYVLRVWCFALPEPVLEGIGRGFRVWLRIGLVNVDFM